MTHTASSATGSASRADNQPSAAVTTAAPGDSCTWYADARCAKPRSCIDCLNVPLANGSECTINPFGGCVSLQLYAWGDDYRLHTPSDLANFYPSTNTTYCTQTDAGCADCRARPTVGVSGLYGYALPTAPVALCTGANGCVCVAACETMDWRQNILLREKCSELPSIRLFNFRSSSQITYVLLGISVGGLLILLVLVRRWWLGHRIGARRRVRFTKLRLRLEGWYTLRQKLIDDENDERGDDKPTLRLQRQGRDNDDDADADVEGGRGDADDVATTPENVARLLVEHGAGYRPLSPSEYPSRQGREDPYASAA